MESLTAFKQAWPDWARTIAAMDEQLRDLSGSPMPEARWADCVGTPNAKKQRDYTRSVLEAHAHGLISALPVEEADKVEQAAGKGAGQFLMPAEGIEPLSDAHFTVAVRRRLRCSRVGIGRCTCCHKDRHGRRCGHDMQEDGGRHALCCPSGGGQTIRHDWVRDALAAWLQEQGKSARTEEEVSRWNKDGERAILDVVYQDQQWGSISIDVSVVDSEGPAGGQRQAHLALARRESTKHGRYPGLGLYPVVLDTRGRWGVEAAAWAYSVVRHRPGPEKAEALARCRTMVSLALQRGVAEQIISSFREAGDSEAASSAGRGGGTVVSGVSPTATGNPPAAGSTG